MIMHRWCNDDEQAFIIGPTYHTIPSILMLLLLKMMMMMMMMILLLHIIAFDLADNISTE